MPSEKDKNTPGVVYAVEDLREPGRIRYVGRTIQGLRTRAQGHWWDARAGKPGAFRNWLRSKSETPETVVFKVLEEHPDVPALNAAETSWISRLREVGQADLNLTNGGDGGWGRVFTPEQRKAHKESVPRGEGHPHHKLTWKEVREIRHFRQFRYENDGDMGAMYGVSRGTASDVLTNTTWHDPEYDPKTLYRPAAKGDLSNRRKVSSKDVREMRELRVREYRTNAQVGELYGLSKDMVRLILLNIHWTDPDYDPSKLKAKNSK